MTALPPPLPPSVTPAKNGGRRFATLRTVLALLLREMSTSYGRTPGGYLWAVVEPLAAIIVLSIGFSLIVRTPSLGTSFLLFYATGYLPFDLYQNVSRATSRAISFSKPLLKYPAVTWMDAILARFFLNSLTSVLISILLLSGVMLVTDTHASLDLPPVVTAMVLAMILGLGVGTINCALIGLFPIWDIAWSIITRPLFLASGVLYTFESLPPLAQNILWYNPLVHIIGLMRVGFYSTYTASYVNEIYVLGVSLGLMAMGQILLGRYHRDILNR